MSRRSLNAYQSAHPRAARLERWLHRRMDALVGNSAAVCEELAAEGAPAERIALIPNGVVTGPTGTAREAMRARLGIAPDALVILCVATLIPCTGHADLIEAFARARAALPNAVLVLAGRDDGLGVAVMAQAEARAVIDAVRILGPRDDVPDLLGAADLFALASHGEGAPNAVIEAMGAGCACVVTAVGGSAEAVGDAGLVVRPRDPAALAEALVRLGGDAALRAALGRSAAARAAERFSLVRPWRGPGPYPGMRCQPLRLSFPRRDVRALVTPGGAAERAHRSDGLRQARGQHRLPVRPARDPRGGAVGKFVPVGDPEALAQAIAHVLRTPRSELPDVRRRARDFDQDLAIDATLDALGAPARIMREGRGAGSPRGGPARRPKTEKPSDEAA